MTTQTTVFDMTVLTQPLVQLAGLHTLINGDELPSTENLAAYREQREQILATLRTTQLEKLVSLMVAAGILDVAVGDLNDETDGYIALEAIDFYETNTGFTLQAGEIHTSGPGVHNKMPRAITAWFDDYSIVKNAA
jgi:hypothetical protein